MEGGRGDAQLAWPRDPVNKKRENNAHRGRCDVTFYYSCTEKSHKINVVYCSFKAQLQA